jgi:dihydroneopterin aldolase
MQTVHYGEVCMQLAEVARSTSDQLLERYRQQVSQLRALALGENAARLQSALNDVDNTTRSERQVWQALRGGAAD